MKSIEFGFQESPVNTRAEINGKVEEYPKRKSWGIWYNYAMKAMRLT